MGTDQKLPSVNWPATQPASKRSEYLKIGLVSDVHCNIKALEKAFELMSSADEFCCLGDCIDQSKFSNEVVSLLRDRCVHVIQGNHEEVFFGRGSERARSHDWIDAELMTWLESRDPEVELERCGKRIHLVHSTPWHPRGEYVTPSNRQFHRFGDTESDIVIYGHTHVPVAQTVDGTLIVNPGSTGQGSLFGIERKMSCAILDVVTNDVELISFESHHATVIPPSTHMQQPVT